MSRRYGATPSVEARVYHESTRYGATPSVEARVYHESRRYGATPSVEARVYHETTRYGATPSIEPDYRVAAPSIEPAYRYATPSIEPAYRYATPSIEANQDVEVRYNPFRGVANANNPRLAPYGGEIDGRRTRKYRAADDVYPTTQGTRIDPAIICEDSRSKTRFTFTGYKVEISKDDGKFSKFALYGRWASIAEQKAPIDTIFEPNEVVVEFCGFPARMALEQGQLEDSSGHFWVSGDSDRRLPALQALRDFLKTEGNLPFVADLSEEKQLLWRTMASLLTENNLDNFSAYEASPRFTEFTPR
jgi:hypothetical protein